MKKIVVFQFTDFDEDIKELAKEIASEFEGVTEVVEVEGGEGQLEVRGEFSSSELKKELKKIDESVETIKIRADGVKEPEVKNQQQGKGKQPKVKIQQQDKGKEPEVKTQQQDVGKLPSNIRKPFRPSDVASSSNSRGVQEKGYLEKAIDVAKQAKDVGVDAAGKAIGFGVDAAGKAIVVGVDAAGKAIEYYGKKNKEKEAKAKLERKAIVGKGGNRLQFPKAQAGNVTRVFEVLIKNEEEKAERWRKQAAAMKKHAEEMEQKKIRGKEEMEQKMIRGKEEMEQRKNMLEKEKQKMKEKNLAINKEEEKLKIWEENMKKQGLEKNSCACIIL